MFNEDEEQEEEVSKIKAICYRCSDCHTSFCTLSDKEKISICPMCGKTNIESHEISENRELYYIPFRKSKQDAFTNFKKKIRFNPLIPFTFKTKKADSFIKRIYIPALLLDAKQEGSITFLGGEKTMADNSNKKFETKKYNVVHSVKVKYEGVFVNASMVIRDDIFKNIDSYNPQLLTKIEDNGQFEGIYLLSDMTVQDIGNRGREKIAKNTIALVRENIMHPLKKFQEDKTMITFENTKQVLLPIYYGKISYRNKDYYYFMNGENGKSYIEVTRGILELVIYSIVIFLVVFLIGYCIAYFF